VSLRLRPGHRVFVYSEYVDMRSGFERLSFVVREKMRQNLLEGDLFVFLGKSRKLLKLICFDGTGLLLIAKRLHQSRFMAVDRFEDFNLSAEELDTLLRGSVIRRTRFGEEALTRRPENCTLSLDGADRARAEC
jgi:transposase